MCVLEADTKARIDAYLLLKSEYLPAYTPVIFLYNERNTNNIIHGYESGCDDFLVRPFAPEKLKAKIYHSINISDENKNLNSKCHAVWLLMH